MRLRHKKVVKKLNYGKDFMKIEFNTNDDLPLNELSKLHMLKLVVRPVFEEDGTFYHKFI